MQSRYIFHFDSVLNFRLFFLSSQILITKFIAKWKWEFRESNAIFIIENNCMQCIKKIHTKLECEVCIEKKLYLRCMNSLMNIVRATIVMNKWIKFLMFPVKIILVFFRLSCRYHFLLIQASNITIWYA